MDVSRAKYGMGIKSVSQTQYRDDLQASVTVNPVEGPSASDVSLQIFWQDGGEASTATLRSFGGMVSPHLRSAQTAFKHVLETAVKLSNTSQSIRRRVPVGGSGEDCGTCAAQDPA